MNEPFHCLDVNIICKHDFTRAGKNDSVYSRPIFLIGQFVTMEITGKLGWLSYPAKQKLHPHGSLFMGTLLFPRHSMDWLTFLSSSTLFCFLLQQCARNGLHRESKLSQQPAALHSVYILLFLWIRKAEHNVTKGSHKLAKMCNLVVSCIINAALVRVFPYG